MKVIDCMSNKKSFCHKSLRTHCKKLVSSFFFVAWWLLKLVGKKRAIFLVFRVLRVCRSDRSLCHCHRHTSETCATCAAENSVKVFPPRCVSCALDFSARAFHLFLFFFYSATKCAVKPETWTKRAEIS